MTYTKPSNWLVALTIAATAVTGVTAATTTTRQPAKRVDAYDVKTLARPEAPARSVKGTDKKMLRKRLSADAEVLTFTGAFQSFHENYVFNYAGGEFLTYDVNVTLDGENATISNLFNLVEGYPYDNSTQEDIPAKYDAAKNTITISTPWEFDQATIAGKYYNYFPLGLICGKVDDKGGITPERELVIRLSDDHTRATFDTNFGLRMFTAEGEAQGFKVIYKGGLMKTDLDTPETVCFTEAIDFGRSYPGDSNERSFNLFNLSSEAMTPAIGISGEGFSLSEEPEEIEPLEAMSVQLTFSPATTGTHKATATVGSHEIILTGEGIEMPDFSYLVKNGEMSFYTDANSQFTRMEKDGVIMARSRNEAVTGSDSYLNVSFDVPEGKLGVISWEGISSSEIEFACVPTIKADDEVIYNFAGMIDQNIAGNHTFGPGHHTLTFDYLIESSIYMTENDYMAVHSLGLQMSDITAKSACLVTDKVRFPNSILFEGNTVKNAEIILRNEGSSPLEVTDVKTPDYISADIPDEKPGLLETITIPLTFTSDKAGTFEGAIDLTTSAGKFSVPFCATVRDMPDFQSIVAEGDFTFTTDEENPFLVKDGVAYNSTSKVKDTKLTTSSMTASFKVPEGKLGILSWKGRVSSMPMTDKGWTDYLNIAIRNTTGLFFVVVPGSYDLDTQYYPYIDAPDMSNLVCPPGDCYINFSYIQYGDGVYGGDDIAEIHDLALKLVDSEEYSATLINETVEFPTVYNGKKSTASVRLLNTGTKPLEIIDVVSESDFYGVAPTIQTPYNQTIDIKLTFEPTSAGLHEDEIIIATNAGDFTVKCIGNALSTEGLLLIEDFENDAEGWSIYDRDGDNDAWNLAWNVFGGVPQGHVHSGEECIVSFSWDYVNGTFQPDNWTFSPMFTVPETGAYLTWYSAADDENRLGDRYSVYACEGDFENAFAFENYKELFTEELNYTEWKRNIVNLADFAGKDIHIAFRHHDSEGFYMVKIDDVFVYEKNPGEDGVAELDTDRKVTGVEYRSLDGLRIKRPTQGVAIVTTTYSDGTSKTEKVVIR